MYCWLLVNTVLLILSMIFHILARLDTGGTIEILVKHLIQIGYSNFYRLYSDPLLPNKNFMCTHK